MQNRLKLVTILTPLLSLCLVLSMAGCGASNSPSYMSQETKSSSSSASAPAAAPRPAAEGMASDSGLMMSATANADTGGGETAVALPPASDRKLIKNADMRLETKAFDTAIPELIRMIEGAGGYVENQSIDGKSMHNTGDYYERSAQITARVPADKLVTVTTQMGTLCNVSSQSESVSDITDSYFDAAAHLEMLKVQEKRLLELLEKAETLENIIQLEQALTNCQYEIESLAGQIRRMDSQVSYSTLYLNINEVVDYTVTTEKPKNFIERLGDAFIRSGKNLAGATESILFFLIIDGPVLAIYLLFWGFIAYIVYRVLRKRRIKSSAKLPVAPIPPTPENRTDSESNL